MKNNIIAYQDADIKSHIADIRLHRAAYSPEINARNLARLIMSSLPGNTVDIVLGEIAGDLKEIILINPSLLLSDYDIQNRIRSTLDRLSDL